MATVSFGTFSKRRNSTKQPSGLSDQRDCKLKETTSVDHPTFIVTGNNFHYNYALWDGRYYFIRDIRSAHNGLTEIDCEIDVLATYKSAILGTTAYVLYDSVSNTEIPDRRLPIKTTKSVQASSAACPLVPDSGCYILSLTGAHNSTGVYKCSQSELAALIDDVAYINDNLFDFPSPPSPPSYNTADSMQAIAENIGTAFQTLVGNIIYLRDCIKFTVSQFFGSGNVTENIRQCIFIPFNRGTTYGQNTIYLGTFETQQSMAKLNTDTIHTSTSVNIPWQASDFRRRSPYTEIYLYLPYIGMTKLSSENLVGQTSLSVSYDLAMRDGSLICTVKSGNQVLGQYSGNVGVSVPVGMSNISMPKAAQAVIGAAAAIATKNPAGVGMAALDFGDAVTPNYSCIGGLDGMASIAADQNITCYTVFHDTVVAPNTALSAVGSPTNAPKSLSGLTGFVQCLDAHVEADAMGEELAEIDSFLNSGIFIE